MLIEIVHKCRTIRNKVRQCYYKLLYKDRYIAAKDMTARKNFTVAISETGSVEIGNRVFFNNGCSLNSLERISIGDDCVFGENVKIYDHNHIYQDAKIPIASQGFTTKKVQIGKNCWIGSNVTIIQGTTIGNHCVIGANCLVFGTIPDHTIVRYAASNIELIHMEE